MTKTVFDFGAVGDGVADDTAAFQAAASAGSLIAPTLTPNGSRATYKITATVELGETVVIIDGVVDASQMPPATSLFGRPVFSAKGAIQADVPITGALPAGTRTLPVGGVSEPGGLVLIKSGERPLPGMTRTDRNTGELVRVKQSDSATTTISAGLYFSYSNGLAIATPITPLKGVRISGSGTIICGGVGSGHSGIFISYAVRPTVSGVRIIGAEDVGIIFEYCWVPQVTEPHVENSTSNPALGNTGYGVLFGGGVRGGIVTRAVLYNCRHGIAGGGRHPAIFCTVDRSYADDALLDCHEPTFEWQFFGNTTTGGNEGLLLRGQHVTSVLNRVFDSANAAIRFKTWDGVNTQRGLRSLFDRVVRAKTGIQALGASDGVEPESIKQGLCVEGAQVVYGGSATTAAVEVSRATEARIEAFTQFNRGLSGMKFVSSRADKLEVHATDTEKTVAFE